MREVVSIFAGQAGCQIGSACWELYGVEHGISPSGEYFTDDVECNGEAFIDSFYAETAPMRYTPRTIFVDTEPSVIDEIRNNQYHDLFKPTSLITGMEDAASNYGRGHYTIGQQIFPELKEAVRSEVEGCDNAAGFFLYHSMSGGTGSGLNSLMMNWMQEEYGKKYKLEYCIYPSPRLSASTVQAYNAVLGAHAGMEFSDCCFLVDNEALYEICTNKLDMENGSYVNLNRILAQVISSITAPMRFSGDLNCDMSEFQTNLVPFPRIHFPLVTYAPFHSKKKAAHERVTASQLTRMCFDKGNLLLKCDPSKGKYMACCMLYRGAVSPEEVNTSIRFIKESKIQFVEWCPTAFKVGLNYQPPVSVPGSGLSNTKLSLAAICNSTAIAPVWSRVNYKFDLMFSKRAYVHWFVGEGMEESEFITSREDLAALEKDYEECAREEEIGDKGAVA